MLNQCIFVGKVHKVVSYNEEGLTVKLETASLGLYPKSIISVDIPKNMVMSEMLTQGNMIAVKARAVSDDGDTHTFVVERITMIGGANNAR